jgi:hypothetical protein
MSTEVIMGAYDDFIRSKAQEGSEHGFKPRFIPSGLKGFQAAMVEWAVRKGRAAMFEDCGMGKTYQSLVWAQNVAEHTNKPVLILSPLAVAQQTVREGEKFGIDVRRSHGGKVSGDIVVTNYQRLHEFDCGMFGGVVCDESSILKNFDGAFKAEITEFMRKVPYRLLCTATAAPNDYIELGTSSEALGYLGFMDMLNRFFKNDLNNSAIRRNYGEAPKWRFKGHAELPFWRWVCSWARAMRKPSDLGFDDHEYVLPPLIEQEHLVSSQFRPDGMLFESPAFTLPEQRQEQRATIKERCEMVARLVDHDKPALVWCHLDEEGDTLEKMIPGSVQISGKNKDEVKEERFLAFSDEQIRVLITKPKIGALGLNFQHCAHITYFPSHSYESYYQAVRRCWRFGQKNEVVVDVIHTEGQRKVLENLNRKAVAAQTMFANLVAEMNNAIGVERINDHTKKIEVPSWL